jgi:RND family efflux transporter MFP subunit
MAALAHAVLKTLLIGRGLRVGMIILALGAAGAGAGWLVKNQATGQDIPRGGSSQVPGLQDLATAIVRPGKLHAAVSEPGLVVRARTHQGICMLEGQHVITWILPDKSVVKKGDLVCRLDLGPLKNQLEAQSAAIKAADADRQSAKTAAEAAQGALQEYTTASTVSQPNVLKALQAHAEDQQANVLAKTTAWDAAVAKDRVLRRQVDYCDLHAPIDGVILYANDPRRVFNNRTAIASGATVRERQIIFTMPNIESALEVETHAPKWSVEHLARGSKVRIRAGGGPDRVLAGRISEIARLPDPTSFFDTGPPVYTTRIKLDDPPPYLATEMQVRVDIDVADLDHVLTVPVSAVISFQGENHVAVKGTVGGLEWREVKLGISNGAVTEVKDGVRAGDQVILEPAKLLPRQGRPSGRIKPAAPAAKEPRVR